MSDSDPGSRNSNSERDALLRAMPSVDECVRALVRDGRTAGLGRAYVTLMVRRAQSAMRAAIMAGNGAPARTPDAIPDALARMALEAIAADASAMRPVVNATGIVIHTNLGRALLAEAAIEAVVAAARAPINLEYDLERGVRGDRDSIVEADLCALTGAEAATVVNNNAAAVMLALNSLAAGREVIVSRGELIEIGGSFRIPDVMERAGVRLREVGTTNRTHPDDYERAICPDTALLLKVHPSNYRVVGFTAEVAIGELAAIGARHGIDVVEDLGAGALADLAAYGLPREPVVADRIAAGAALVTFSGDKLLGGPQSGLIVGRRGLVAKLKANPLKRALRCDKLTIAALDATLRLYARGADLSAAIPTLRYLSRTVGELEMLAARARPLLAERLGPQFDITIVASQAEVGSGSMPNEKLESRALRVTHPTLSAGAIAAMFRKGRPAVIGRISGDAFILDLRTVDEPAALAVDLAIPFDVTPPKS
ncbi:MAG TPA: L-seryl-tRNA(Sec) selenium transferase [Candidatus Binataceae bacterium]|nr:L-seryl-tRNA(Sec) selenium transferase [Candidatus Binataceae bacterium]